MPNMQNTAWDDALWGLAALAVNPLGLRGIWLKAPHGPVLDEWLNWLRALQGGLHKIPSNVDSERLIGGLDLTQTLQSGKPVQQKGLLSQQEGRIVVCPMAERIATDTAYILAQALDRNAVSPLFGDQTQQALFGLVAIDESTPEDASVETVLREQLSIWLDLSRINPGIAACDHTLSMLERVENVLLKNPQYFHSLINACEINEQRIKDVCELSLGFSIDSMRAPIYAYRLAKTFATLRAAQQVDEEDIGRAARLVLTPRAKSVPHLDSGNPTNPDESNASPSPEDHPSNHLDQSPPPHSNADEGQQTSEAQDLSKSTQPDTHEQDEMSDKSQIEALETSVIEAALATLPPDLLSQLKQGKSSSNKGAHGRVGELKRSNKNGRPLPPIKGKPSNGNRLHVLATLTHAAPRQKLRTQCPQEHSSHSHHEKKFRVKILSDDFHIQRFSKKSESCTIFCLDASGSAALERLAEAKGAVELLLKDSYARRDNICVISFRDRAAQVQLPPTRSLVRAKKNLQSLPGGGGTPLADAIKLAMSTALQVRSQGMTPSLIVLSDGRANVTLEGEGSRAVAKSQALKLAEQWRATQIQSVWLDTSPRSDPQAQEVAQVMGAKYIPLPLANSQNMANAVKQSRSV